MKMLDDDLPNRATLPFLFIRNHWTVSGADIEAILRGQKKCRRHK